MEYGQFGDGLMVRGKHLIFLEGLSAYSYTPYEEMVLMKPQVVISPTVSAAPKSKPFINSPSQFIKVVSVQKHFSVRGRPEHGLLIRLEHMFQPEETTEDIARD